MELLFLFILIGLMVGALASGYPVAFALPGASIITIVLAGISGYVFTGDAGSYFHQGDPFEWLSAGVSNLRSLYWVVERDTLIAIPLFVFMGIMFQRSKIAEDLLIAMAQLFGPVPGGLGISVVFVGALLAATTGIVGATVIAMGLISLPCMMNNKYSKTLATGTICASGTLGQIIPPSIVLIILADQLGGAADQANNARTEAYKLVNGTFSMPSEFSVSSASAGDMFMGALIPGVVLVIFYMGYILVKALLNPETAPSLANQTTYDRQFVNRVILSLVPPLSLIFVVLGSIISGVSTVNQAGAIGAVGATIMAGYRLHGDTKRSYMPAFLAVTAIISILVLIWAFEPNIKNIQTTLDLIGVMLAFIAVMVFLFATGWSLIRIYKTNNTLTEVMSETAKTTSMVFVILIGAAMLTSVFRAFGGEEIVREMLVGLPGGFWMQFMLVMLVIFILGFFLDFIEIAVVVVPIVAPILLMDPSANITAVWLGVMVGMNIQTSFLTPPFGFSLFYLRSVAPPEIKTTDIYRGVLSFITLQILVIAIIGYFPTLVNYLPNRTYLTSNNAPPPMNPKLQLCIEELIFAEYKEKEQSIKEGIIAISTINNTSLPPSLLQTLNHSLSLAHETFENVSKVQVSQQEFEDHASSYRPLHKQVRTIQNKISKTESLIMKKKQEMDRLDDFSDNAVEMEIQQSLLELNDELKALYASIPINWSDENANFEKIKQGLINAQRKYRSNVDESYDNLMMVINQIDSVSAIEALTVDFEKAGYILNEKNKNINELKSMFKQISIDTGKLNLHTLQKEILKIRKLLRTNNPNWEKAQTYYNDAFSLLHSEIRWRERSQGIVEKLKEFEKTIRYNIGFRLQDHFPNKGVAKQIALCQSEHRDNSLYF